MSTRKLMAGIAIAAIGVGAGLPTYAANPTLDITDDATALKVTVPAGCLASMKLELAYDTGTNDSSMYVRSDAATRSAWTNARTLSESVPAAGATYTVPLSELGVSADASFRLFASSTDIALLDYVEQNDSDSGHDTGIPDNICYALEYGQIPKTLNVQYPTVIGSILPNGKYGFAIQHNQRATAGYFEQWSGGKYTYRALTFKTSEMNVCTFTTNKVLTFNGTQLAPGAGASAWTTPLGTSTTNLFLGRFVNETGLKIQSRWYYLKLYGSDNAALLDYVPAKRKSDGVAGFYDRAAVKFVTPSDGGAFTGGTVTNDTFVVAATAIGGICSFPRLARVPAVTTLDTSDGATLTIEVRPGHGAGSKLYLAHDTTDKGGDIADWTGKLEVCSSIPAAGGTYTVDLAAQGLDSGRVFRAFIANRYTLLERVQQNSTDDVIDTGIADAICGGMEFGYYCTGYSSNKYAGIIGTGEGSGVAQCGFRVCLGGSTTKIMFGQFVNNLYTYKFIYFTANVRNVLKAENNTLTLNGGTAVLPEAGNKSSWRTTPLGLSRNTALLGRLPTDSTTTSCSYGWWYYLKLKGLDGNLLLDYVPVMDSNGTAGFLDRVSASFVTPTSGGSLVAGDAVGEEAWDCVSLSETMTCDADTPVTAAWIGGTSSALNNPANWACTNFLGAALPATTLPVADVTDVTIGGNVSFSCSTAADKIWRNATVLDTTLADACDWRGFGDGFTLDGTIDLAGHSLTLAGAPPGGTITSSASGDPVALHFVIPAGVTNENVNCAITGNLRLFKEGAGMLVATKYPQTYSGGTDIVAGTLKAGVPGDINRVAQGSYFGSLKTLDVRSAGTLDSGGTYYWGYHTINLHGGTLTTSVQPTTYGFNPKIYLTANSTLEVTGSSDNKSPLLDLGGHTLNINFHNNAWHVFTSSATNGNIVATGSGVMNFDKDSAITCPTAAFDIGEGVRFHVKCPSVVMGDLIVRTSNVTYSGSHAVKVKGRFTPVTQYFPRVQLQDGATLDLSGREGTWPVESLVSACSLSFAANATVTVAVGGRNVPSRLVSWTAMPAGADTLTVLCDNSDIKLEVRADGIYRKRGLMIIVR